MRATGHLLSGRNYFLFFFHFTGIYALVSFMNGVGMRANFYNKQISPTGSLLPIKLFFTYFLITTACGLLLLCYSPATVAFFD